MQSLKTLFDPENRLNPGKVLPTGKGCMEIRQLPPWCFRAAARLRFRDRFRLAREESRHRHDDSPRASASSHRQRRSPGAPFEERDHRDTLWRRSLSREADVLFHKGSGGVNPERFSYRSGISLECPLTPELPLIGWQYLPGRVLAPHCHCPVEIPRSVSSRDDVTRAIWTAGNFQMRFSPV